MAGTPDPTDIKVRGTAKKGGFTEALEKLRHTAHQAGAVGGWGRQVWARACFQLPDLLRGLIPGHYLRKLSEILGKNPC